MASSGRVERKRVIRRKEEGEREQATTTALKFV